MPIAVAQSDRGNAAARPFDELRVVSLSNQRTALQ